MADKGNLPSRGRGRGRRDRSASVTRPGGGGVEQPIGKAAAPEAKENVVPAAANSAKNGENASTGSGSAGSTTSTIESFVAALRPGYGQTGRPIQLRTNNYRIQLNNPGLEMNSYSVEIKNEFRICRRDESYALYWEMARNLGFMKEEFGVIYDGGNKMYSTTKLVFPDGKDYYSGSVNMKLPHYGRTSSYSVSIKNSGVVKFDFNDDKTGQQALTILDLILRQYYNQPDDKFNNKKPFFPCGRSIFFIPSAGDQTSFSLDAGLECWSGYFLAAKIADGGFPIMNIDIANGIFAKPQSALALMCEILTKEAGGNYSVAQLEALKTAHYLTTREVKPLNKAFKGLQVVAKNTPNQVQRVSGITDLPAEKVTFEWNPKGGQGSNSVSVAQYYAERYKQPLRFPFLPVLVVGSKKKPAFLPIEMCTVHIPQRIGGKLDDKQTATMIRGVCTDAMERARRIGRMISLAKLDSDPYMRNLGFQINTNMMEVRGRTINPPQIEYLNNARVAPRDGVWNMGREKFFTGAALPAYGVVSFLGPSEQTKQELKQFCSNLMNEALKMGMQVGMELPISVGWVAGVDKLREAMHNCVSDGAQKGKVCALIIVVMPQKDIHAYAATKSIGDKDLGVPTQVAVLKTVRNAKPQTCQNIVLKINAKLGGINSKLFVDAVSGKYLVNQPTLVLGMDVTHPGPTDRKSPSIGAAVGNIDILPARFGASISVQQQRREPVVYLTSALKERVAEFWTQTRRKPERVLMYRDGVAEGQFLTVVKEEIKSIKTACEDIFGKDFVPKITFIVVQKRHHTRFFCQNQQEASGKGKNVPPGTVVDSTITHRNQFDFYLCSHFGIQGTSRPAHYHVLQDDNEFKPDELQAITYYLCHMYYRCNRSVSIPAPTYYAHLACSRARQHLADILGDSASIDTMSVAGSDSSKDTTASEEAMTKAVAVTDSFKTAMYFC